MANISDIRNGLCIDYNNDLYTVIQFQHVKPARGAAFMRTKLKHVTSGKVIENTFQGSAKINTVRIERRSYQYLYKDETGFVCMNNETFEQIGIPEHLVENSDLLLEGNSVEITFHAENEMPLIVELPPFVVMEVTYTEPGLKGDTATNTLKKATIETGAEIMVPLFVNVGDKIKVDTRDRSYSERVK